MTRNTYSPNGRFTGLSIVLLLAGALAAPAHAADGSRRVIDFDSCAKPQYPAADIQARHEGTVTLAFRLDEKGGVTESKVEKSSGFSGLDEAAHTAIAKCRFSPAKAGVKYAKWTHVSYKWVLK